MSNIVVNPNTAQNNPRIDFSNNNFTGFIDLSSNSGNNFELGTQTGNIRLLTAGTERMRLLNNGNVGIGTAQGTTLSTKLYVVGTGTFTTGLNIGIGTASPTRLCISNNAVATCN